MGELTDLFSRYSRLVEEAFDLDGNGNLIEKNSSKVETADLLFHDLFVAHMGDILAELAVPGLGSEETSAGHNFIGRGSDDDDTDEYWRGSYGMGYRPPAPTAPDQDNEFHRDHVITPQSPQAQVPQPRAPQTPPAPNQQSLVGPMIPHPAVMTAMTGNTFAQKAPGIMTNLMRDFNLTPEQAAGIVGNLGHESGGFKQMQELRPASGRGGLGWAQWTGPRRVEYENWAKQNNLDTSSDEANYGFLKHELQTTYAPAVAAVRQQNTVDGSMRAFEGGYERAGIKNYNSRDLYGNQALTAYNQSLQQPTQQPGQPPQAQQAGQGQSQRIAQGKPGQNYLAIGDSLGLGVGSVLGNTRYTHGGWNPQAVNDLVGQAIKDGKVQGQHIILSGGASNAGGDTKLVSTYYPQMIDALKKAGAADVTVMGVGPYSHFDKYGYNNMIGDITKNSGANFTGPLADVTKFSGTNLAGGVHPNDYHPIVSYVQQHFSQPNPQVAQAEQPKPEAPQPNGLPPDQHAAAIPPTQQPAAIPPEQHAAIPPQPTPMPMPQKMPSQQAQIQPVQPQPAPQTPPPPTQAQTEPPPDQKTPQTSSAHPRLRASQIKLSENRRRTMIGILRPYK